MINYFRTNLKKKVYRPNCGRFLPLWDDINWRKREVDINLDYINANDFIIFLYQTKQDMCCMELPQAKMFVNGIDKFLFILYDFQRYFNILVQTKLYKRKCEVIDDLLYYRNKGIYPQRFMTHINLIEIFLDLNKKLNDWIYWRKIIIHSFAKILLTPETYLCAQKQSPDYLNQLISYIEQLFNEGINS